MQVGEMAHQGQTTAPVARFAGSAPATVVSDSDQQVALRESRLQLHYRVRMMGVVSVFHHIGQGFINGQRKIVY